MGRALGEHGGERRGGEVDVPLLVAKVQAGGHLVGATQQPAAGEQLVGDGAERVAVGRGIQRPAGQRLGRRVRAPERRVHPGNAEGAGNPEPADADGAALVHEDVARVQAAVEQPHGMRGVDGLGQRPDESEGDRQIADSSGTQARVERRRRHVPHGNPWGAVVVPGVDQVDQARVRGLPVDELLQRTGDGGRLLRGDVELERLDRDELAVLPLGPEHRTEDTHPDLMQHPEGADRVRTVRGAGEVVVQRIPPQPTTTHGRPRRFAIRTDRPMIIAVARPCRAASRGPSPPS